MSVDAPQIRNLYVRYVQPLAEADQLRLAEIIIQEAIPRTGALIPPGNIMELHGLGAELWANIDAQQYVEALRAEWDDRP